MFIVLDLNAVRMTKRSIHSSGDFSLPPKSDVDLHMTVVDAAPRPGDVAVAASIPIILAKQYKYSILQHGN